MTLKDLKNVIDFNFDLTDYEIDASFYIELDEINEEYAKLIEVTRITKDYVTCKFADFIQNNPCAIAEYIKDNYYEGEQQTYLLNQLTKSEDITDDGGEAVYHFITNDMYDFLTQ